MATALDTRDDTSNVSSTPDTARLARGPTRPSVRPMKLRSRMRSMPAVAVSSATGDATPADSATGGARPKVAPAAGAIARAYARRTGSGGAATVRHRPVGNASHYGVRGPRAPAICWRTGTNSGMTKSRRSQLAPSTTKVWPVTKDGVGRAQPGGGPAQLVQPAQAAGRGAPGVDVGPLGAKRLQIGPHVLVGEEARGEGVDPDPRGRPLHGEGLGQVAHTRLGRGGVGHARSPGEGLGGQHVADGARRARLVARRKSSWEQKKVPSSTICVTARQPLGTGRRPGRGSWPPRC